MSLPESIQTISRRSSERTVQALIRAVDASRLRKWQIAEQAGIKFRTFQRIMTGTTEPSSQQCDRIFAACDISRATSLLAIEFGYEHLIGTPDQAYLDRFFPLMLEHLERLRAEQILPLDYRWAASDARALHARWEQLISRREQFLQDQDIELGAIR